MRQRGSQRVRSRLAASHGKGNSNNSAATPVSYAEQDPSSNQSAGGNVIPMKRCTDAVDENIIEVLTSSDDAAVAAREYLRRINERRTRSERYFLPLVAVPVRRLNVVKFFQNIRRN